MSDILLAITAWQPRGWETQFAELAPGRRIRSIPVTGDRDAIAYACAWKAPPGTFRDLPKLKAIFSLGAGVDHLMSDPDLPDVPILRIVDPNLTMRMSEYIALHVLYHHRQVRMYAEQQKAKIWIEHAQPAAYQTRVGVMGMGVLGSDAAGKLARLGFDVAGWSRSGGIAVDGVKRFAGEGELDAFLARTDILVSVLPHTPATTGILNRAVFEKLARDGRLPGPVLINVGRGKSQVEADILSCLEDGTLDAATLDVFESEPLSQDSPLWSHPKVVVTPHNSASSDPDAIGRYVMAQIAKIEAGETPDNIVDPKAGY